MALNIVARAKWGAPPTPAGPIPLPTPEIWLHHTAGEQHGAAGMKELRDFTMKQRGYIDIPYSFVVDTDGTVFEARGAGHDSAATAQHNAVSHAICVMGNYETMQPTEATLNAVAELLVLGHQRGWWNAARLSGGHRDASGNSTECPGKNLESRISEIDNRAAILEGPPTVVDDDRISLTVVDFKNHGTPAGRYRFVQLAPDDAHHQFRLIVRNGAKIAGHPAGALGVAVTQGSNGKVLGIELQPDSVHFVVTADDGGTFAYRFEA